MTSTSDAVAAIYSGNMLIYIVSSSSMCCSGSEAMEAILVSTTWLSELADRISWSWNRLYWTDQTLHTRGSRVV